MTNQPLFETYLIKPKNQDFVTGKASLPVSLVFPQNILGIHKWIITINKILLAFCPIYTPLLLNELLLGLANIKSNTIFYIPFSINEWLLNLENIQLKNTFFDLLVNTEYLSIFIVFIYAIAIFLNILVFWSILINYEPWLAKRILLKGGKVIEGWICDVRFIIRSESDEMEILFELPTPDGNSIKGKLCCDIPKGVRPVPGNRLKFLYLNKQCYFFL